MDLISVAPEVDEESAITGELLPAQPVKSINNITLTKNAWLKDLGFIRHPPLLQQYS